MRLGLFALTFACTTALGRLTAQPHPVRHGMIRGVVLDTLRRPAPGVMVQLLTDSVVPTQPPGRGVTRYRGMIAIDTTDSAGRFSFRSLSPRRYALTAHAVWVEGGADSLVIGADDTLSVELPLRVRYHAETPASVRTALLARLAEAEARWAARRPARYRLTAELECFCFGAMDGARTLEFRDDSLVAIIDRQGRRDPATALWWKTFSAPSLLAAAESASRDLELFVKKIEYDPTYGVPTLIDTDTAYGFTDGWSRQRVRGFRPMPYAVGAVVLPSAAAKRRGRGGGIPSDPDPVGRPRPTGDLPTAVWRHIVTPPPTAQSYGPRYVPRLLQPHLGCGARVYSLWATSRRGCSTGARACVLDDGPAPANRGPRGVAAPRRTSMSVLRLGKCEATVSRLS